jgi:hypothetical protein
MDTLRGGGARRGRGRGVEHVKVGEEACGCVLHVVSVRVDAAERDHGGVEDDAGETLAGEEGVDLKEGNN